MNESFFLPTHTVCEFYSIPVLKDPWPCLRPRAFDHKGHDCSGPGEGQYMFDLWEQWWVCKRYTVIALCSDQHRLLHAVSSLSSRTVGEKSMLLCDKSTSLSVNCTHVFPVVFSALFQTAWSLESCNSLILQMKCPPAFELWRCTPAKQILQVQSTGW